MIRWFLALLVGFTLLPAAVSAGPKEELDAAYAKLEALAGYRERISFHLENFGEMEPGGSDEELEGMGGFNPAAMLAPFKQGMVREVAKGGHSRMTFSMPNPSPAGKQLTFELVDFGERFATRYDDPAMRAVGKAATISANAQMATQSGLSLLRSAATAAVNPFGAMDDLFATGAAAGSMAAAASGAGVGDMGKWVCRKGEADPDRTAGARVEALSDSSVGGKAVRRYRLIPPSSLEDAPPSIIAVDKDSGLPVQVDVLGEAGKPFTTIALTDFGTPIRIEFPKCDEDE